MTKRWEARGVRQLAEDLLAERDAARGDVERLRAALGQIIDIMDAEPDSTWYGRAEVQRRILQAAVDAIVASERPS